VLREVNEKAAARAAYEEALEIYRELAAVQPAIYQAYVAATLNNLGTVLRDLNERAAARAAYREAEQLFLTAGEQVELGRLYSNLADLEAEEGGQFCNLAITLSEQSVRSVEAILECLEPLEHNARDNFKRAVERAYQRLILFHASGLPGSDRTRLPGLLEALRQVDLLAGSADGAASDGTWKSALREIAQGTGPLAAWMNDHKAALLWTQVTHDRLVFVIQRTGCPLVVEIGDDQCVNAFRIAAEALKEHVRFVQDERPRERVRQNDALALGDLAAQCHEMLPREVQRLLEDSECETIILASCGESTHYCWELLRMGDRYLGLEKVVARVYGLRELADVHGRHVGYKKAVAVGNPIHEDCPGLPAAGAYLWELVQHLHGWTVTQSNWIPVNQEGTEFAAVGERATLPVMRKWLEQGDLGLLVFSGHGDALALALEGRDVFTVEDMRGMKWQGGPLVHLDCCLAGVNRSIGGGKFIGMPVAMLQSGASAVVASAHPLYDGHAAFFARVLYDRMLDAVHPLGVGEALLAARRETHAEFGNPVHWATTVLWGNPTVQLPR
jgi:CHAT domain-containing protein